MNAEKVTESLNANPEHVWHADYSGAIFEYEIVARRAGSGTIAVLKGSDIAVLASKECFATKGACAADAATVFMRRAQDALAKASDLGQEAVKT